MRIRKGWVVLAGGGGAESLLQGVYALVLITGVELSILFKAWKGTLSQCSYT